MSTVTLTTYHKVTKPTNLLNPVFKQLVSAELQTEALAISLQLGTLNVLLPALAQNVFHAAHICVQLALNLRAHNNPHICTKSTVKFEKIKKDIVHFLF